MNGEIETRPQDTQEDKMSTILSKKIYNEIESQTLGKFCEKENPEQIRRDLSKALAKIFLQSTIDCLKGMMIKDDNDDFEKCWYNDQLESKISEIESQIKELHK